MPLALRLPFITKRLASHGLGLLLALLAIGLAASALAPAASAQVTPLGAHNPALFSPPDVLNAGLLMRKINSQADPVSAFLRGKFSTTVNATLANAAAARSEQLSALVSGLNSVLEGDSIFDQQRFAGVGSSPELVALAGQAPQGDALVRLNRLLLEDAYRLELRRSTLLQLVVASVSTDKSDYAPGTTAYIRGRGFQAGESVSLCVLHYDGTSDNGLDHQPWSVTAGSDGAFESSWHVCEDDCLGSTLRLTAIGQTSSKTAQAIFTDATGAPSFQRLKSFGLPSSGGSPASELIQGTDGALYGTTTAGGASQLGTVFKINSDGSGFTVLHHADNATGARLYSGLIQATDGALYGAASAGGDYGSGTLFRLNTDGSGFAVLVHLDYYTTGALPVPGLTQGMDGALYGTTLYGGIGGYGTVFKLNTDGTGFSVLQNFDYYTTGGYLQSVLTQGNDGALYGTAAQGGSSSGGTAFKLNPDGTGFSVLHNFDSYASGGLPTSGLMQANDGLLYGSTVEGGSAFGGTVFKMNPDGTDFAVIANLDQATTGSKPYSLLLQGTDGALYGTANEGSGSVAGTVFKLNTDGTDFTVLHNFSWASDGANPTCALLQGADGAIYGTTYQGGSGTSGTVFKLNTDGSDFTVLKALTNYGDTSESGGNLRSELLQGADGALYGTATNGGSGLGGTLFKLNTNGTGFSVLQYLESSATSGLSTTGENPYAGLIQGTDGALYGTAYQGGSGQGGTAFRMNTNGTGFSVLQNFNTYSGASGGFLSAGLLQGTDGALYGAASQGGISGFGGTLFKFNTDGTGFGVLQNFDYYTSGAGPVGALIQGPDGALYGTANYGGSAGSGTLFKLNADGSGFSVLQNFDYATGGYLYARLLQAADGALYGTTTYGGSAGYGTVFKLNTDGTGFSVLANFDYSTNGAYPNSGLLQATDGALYGTAILGGSGYFGTAFRLNTDGTDFTVLQNFDSVTTGALPYGALIEGTDGNLYGTTAQGGEADSGTVYRLVFHTPLVAQAGVDFSMNEGQFVTLTGSGSGGPEGEASTFAWQQLPGGTAVVLTGADSAIMSFTAPTVPLGGETLSFQLTVSAGDEVSTDAINVTVVNVNHTPVAEAGLDQSIAEGSPVTLHGEDSFDIDNDAFSHHWVQVSGSPTVSLVGAQTANPSFTAPYVGSGGASGVVATLVFELQVADGYPQDAPAPGYSFADAIDRVTVVITHVNNEPVAEAGENQTVNENAPVMLNGAASSDPDSDLLTYSWVQLGGPAVTLANPLTATPSFTTPFVSVSGANLRFLLLVEDGFGGLLSNSVVVHVQNINNPPYVGNAIASICRICDGRRHGHRANCDEHCDGKKHKQERCEHQRPLDIDASRSPPDHGMVNVCILGVIDPESNATITITGVTQDEPTGGLGGGDTAIDAVIRPNGTLLLRAERAGNGNGRVYHIHFTATDLEGSAAGVVTVKVPRQKQSVAIDGGELHDSTH